MAWAPMGASILAALILALAFSDPQDPFRALNGLRMAGAVLAVGASFSFDGQSRELETATPLSIRAPTALRLLTSAAITFAALALAWEISSIRAGHPAPASLFLEAAGLICIGWAAALLAVRHGDARLGGVVGGSAVLVFATIFALLPEGIAMFAVYPGEASWGPSRWRWALVVALGIAASAPRFRSRA